ncbi:LacI family DNA-binding transcriptional regulator [Microbacterium hominis]|uniref:LacI family DNA-binding transcriptional regulator n=1 Tax=Microbacterium hominis TaxID=162426 RepID=A0A7D4PKZ5_9MICO|nr:LacI family DNA-binding transcriptional regulator [Microbacterium hominis]QKJ18570.1 LacI family DNA-binding transcriptional regulator [Microbacterium hominis]
MATGRDVAKLAGTSTAVVSYVFNNGPRNVSAETRAKVLAAAEKLNYHPNALARALSFGRTASVGLIVPDIANPFFGELARALEDAAISRGDLLLIGDSALDVDREAQIVAAFVERRVDSVVMVSLHEHPDFSAFTRAGIPIVALHPVDAASPASSVTIDYDAASRAAAEHMIGHGYETIALLNGPSESVGAGHHRRGFAAAVAAGVAAGGASIRTTEVNSATSRADAATMALDWLVTPDRPRAVICATDEQAYGVLHAAHRLGLRVPQDLAVMGFDGTEHSAYAVPALSTVRQPIPLIAERAVGLLRDAESGPVHEVLGHELELRESCGCHDEAGSAHR